jgi:acetylornithine deacetylase/succinyl-diaminopimelate desuccinylase-like protein
MRQVLRQGRYKVQDYHIDKLMNKVEPLIEGRWESYLGEVRDFLRMPSISPTGEGIEATAAFLRDFLEDRFEVDSKLLRYGGHPIVYGWMDNHADKTLILYSMYDVLPVEPLHEWMTPPFGAEIVDDNIIARGAVNTKAPLMSTLLGVEILRDALGDIPVNLCFIMEGEEETGSRSMVRLVEDKKEELKDCGAAFFMMPTENSKGKPQIILGKKGIIFVEMRIRESRYDVHASYAQLHTNPVEVASNLISSLKDKEGNIVADWVYDGVVTPTEQDLEYLPELMESFNLEEIVESYSIDMVRASGEDAYIKVFYEPSVNICGILGGYVEEGTKTITPAEVMIKMDFRLVPNMTPQGTLSKFMTHLERLGLRERVETKLYHNYDWSRTPPDARITKAAKRAFQDLGMPSYIVTSSQGSAPEYLFTKKLGIPIITAGPGYGGRIHAPNEFIEVEGVRKMIEYIPFLIRNWADEEG